MSNDDNYYRESKPEKRNIALQRNSVGALVMILRAKRSGLDTERVLVNGCFEFELADDKAGDTTPVCGERNGASA